VMAHFEYTWSNVGEGYKRALTAQSDEVDSRS